MTQLLIPLGVIVLAGTALALQAPLNAALGRAMGTATGAAAVSFGVGFVVLLAVTAARGEGGGFVRALTADPRLWLGGVLGAFYVWAVLWSVPTLGIVTAFAALILGQMGMALVLDAVGAFGLTVHAVTWQRVAAVGLVAAGLVLSRY